MINQKLDSGPMTPFRTFDVLILVDLAFAFPVELDQKQRLVLHRGKQVVFSDEIKNVWPSQSKEVGQCLARLSIREVKLSNAFKQEWIVF